MGFETDMERPMIKYLSKRFLSAALLLTSLSGWGAIPEARDPEAATGRQTKTAVNAKEFMVSAANPYATEAGYRILEAGGSAIDAAIAVQMVLTLVEPQSSGIGGGAFLLHWDQSGQQLTSFDGRETAPAAATPDLFVGADGQPMDWWSALAGGRSVGVPGVVAMLAKVHQRYGTLPWGRLFSDAIRLSEQGFRVSERLHRLIAQGTNPALGRYDNAWHYFFPDGKPLPAGALKTNPELADTFRRIATLGPGTFYRGDIAQSMVSAVQGARDNPGLLNTADLITYEAKERPPLCLPYRQYRICGMGPPTSGGVAVLQILKLLEPFKLADYPPMDPQALHLITQAQRLAFADRDRYLADSDFVEVPVEALLDSTYLKQRSLEINPERDRGSVQPGALPLSSTQTEGQTLAQPSTSHFSIVDGKGNAISMTSSIEMAFGSTLMARGFLLNNQLTDFSFRKEQNNKTVANRVQGGKRPRSSMAPTMVFDNDNSLIMAIGSPGGSRIINYVSQTLIGVLDWQLGIQQAIDMPHISNRNGVTDLELETPIAQLKSTLEAKGHQVKERELNSGLHGILLTPEGLQGGADSRREGIVMGM